MSRDLDWTPRVGMKVRCIKRGEWFPRSYGEVCPSFGDILTIREVCGADRLRFYEIVNRTNLYSEGYMETAFAAYRFRPLEEHHSGMAVLREILRTADQRIEEDA